MAGAAADALLTLKTALARHHGPVCPYFHRPRAMPLSRALVEALVHGPRPAHLKVRTATFARSITTLGLRATPSSRLRSPSTALWPGDPATVAARTFATSSPTSAPVLDSHHAVAASPHEAHERDQEHAHAAPGVSCPGSIVLDALNKARARIPKDAPWWWKVAKAQVEANDRARGHIFSRVGPTAAGVHDCHHTHDHSADSTSTLASSSLFSSHSHSSSDSSSSSKEHASCGDDAASCASPVSGCRASSHGWSWWYLALNERRRRDPAKRAHWRQACRTWPGYDRRRGKGGPAGCRRTWRMQCEARDRHTRSVRRLVLQHRLRARRAEKAGPFDYDAFRCAQWAATFRRSGGGHSHRHHHGHHEHRRQRLGWMCTHAPQEWVRHAHRFRSKKTGIAYFMWRASDNAALRIREGGAGAARIDLAKRPAAATPASLLHSSSSSASSRLALRAGTTAAARAFSTTPSRALPFFPPPPGALPPLLHVCTPLELGLPLLLPLAAVLKSSAALNCLAFVTRVSLTLLPLSARSRIIHSLRERYLRDPSSLSSSLFGRCALERHAGTLAAPSGFLARWNALLGLPLLVLTPLVFLALVALASLERTPITGRWRIVMLSPAEEADLVRSVLAPSPASAPAVTPEGTSRDWVAILRRVLALPDEGTSADTHRRRLLGGEVLDPRDWRVRWAGAVLRALEQGGAAALSASAGAGGPEGVLRPPPTAYPLEPRAEAASGAWSDELLLSKPAHAHAAHGAGGAGAAPLRLEYDLLVVDRPDANAFSFGFGPDAARRGAEGEEGTRPRRGVIVVYTGFLDEILGRSPSLSPTTAPNPLQANLTPPTLPTAAQTRALAVLLSHELAHLALSHTLESYASSSLLVPHLARLTSDVLRTVLYPVTALLGPFINDALGRSLTEGASGGWGALGRAVDSCESRKLESEADVVALRLLASSGIDPHFALSFWEDRLSPPSSPSPSAPSSPAAQAAATLTPSLSHPHPLRLHSPPDELFRSHPVDEERVARIRSELGAWERWWAARAPPAAGSASAAAAAAAA
ncbi:hypothetical protein JCM10450v2_004514 [Rhodotorula kratochvilovae]